MKCKLPGMFVFISGILNYIDKIERMLNYIDKIYHI